MQEKNCLELNCKERTIVDNKIKRNRRRCSFDVAREKFKGIRAMETASLKHFITARGLCSFIALMPDHSVK